MDDNVMRVLQLLQDGKISAQEAESLISALTKPVAAKAEEGTRNTEQGTGSSAYQPPTTNPQPSHGLPTGELLQQIADDPSIPESDKLTIIINATSLLCAILIIQPIPLADLVILTPVQVAGVYAMSQVMGQPLDKHGADDLLKSILAVLGGSFLALQLMSAGVKLFVPVFGGLAIIPVVYGATYGLMNAARAILEAKRSNQQLTDDEIRRIKTEAEQRAKSEKRDWSPAALKRDLDTWMVKGEAFKQYETLFQDEQRRAHLLQEEFDLQTAQIFSLSQQKTDWELKAQSATDKLNGELSEEDRQQAQTDKEQTERELESARSQWQSKGAELEAKRGEIKRIYDNLESLLRDRFGRSYPNIGYASGVFAELARAPYEKLKGIERQISLLQYDPVRANFQHEPFLDASGQEVRTIAVDDDTRLYATAQGNLVLVRGIGTRGSEECDVAKMQTS